MIFTTIDPIKYFRSAPKCVEAAAHVNSRHSQHVNDTDKSILSAAAHPYHVTSDSHRPHNKSTPLIRRQPACRQSVKPSKNSIVQTARYKMRKKSKSNVSFNACMITIVSFKRPSTDLRIQSTVFYCLYTHQTFKAWCELRRRHTQRLDSSFYNRFSVQIKPTRINLLGREGHRSLRICAT
jgi:hypothetical protein